MRTIFAAAILAAIAPLPSTAIAAPPAADDAAADAAGRQVTDLGSGWRFHFGDAGSAPAAPDFDDHLWEMVAVPHPAMIAQ